MNSQISTLVIALSSIGVGVFVTWWLMRGQVDAKFRNLLNAIMKEESDRLAGRNQELLGPLQANLREFKESVERVHREATIDRTGLNERVQQLSALNLTLSEDAKKLTEALKGSSKVQGNWGELVLEHVLEASGLRKGEQYRVQESFTREDGSRAQPDVVIYLPENRHLVVDAKVSLNAYQDAVAAEDDAQREAAVKRHLDSIRTHIKGLSAKKYHAMPEGNSLDFVLMFVPIEPAFMLAVTHDKDLFVHAWKNNVLFVGPSTLFFVVGTVAHLWRQAAQTHNTQRIANQGAKLYDCLCECVEDFLDVGKCIELAQESFQSAKKRLSEGRSNAIREAQILTELGIKPKKLLPTALLEGASSDDLQKT
jgi:DNA recombination protein RmuC